MIALIAAAVIMGSQIPATCCDLQGAWMVQLRITDPGRFNPAQPGDSLSGRITLHRSISDPLVALRPSDPRVIHGRHEIDMVPLFGGPYGRDVSRSTRGGGRSLLSEVSASVDSTSEVRVTIIPRMSHGGLGFRGRLERDSVVGEWGQRAYCCGARGTFTMWRIPWTAEQDSLVEQWQREQQEDDRAARAAQEAFRAAAGRVRFRTYDSAIGGFVAASYMLRPLDSAATYYSTIMGSMDAGWSQVRFLEPGRYYVELSSFHCGNETVMPDQAWHQSRPQTFIEIRRGADTDLELHFDSRTVPDAGRRCRR